MGRTTLKTVTSNCCSALPITTLVRENSFAKFVKTLQNFIFHKFHICATLVIFNSDMYCYGFSSDFILDSTFYCSFDEIQVVICFVILQGAVTHKDRTDKSSETFTWTAPSDLRADVIFRLQFHAFYNFNKQLRRETCFFFNFLNFQIVHHTPFFTVSLFSSYYGQ